MSEIVEALNKIARMISDFFEGEANAIEITNLELTSADQEYDWALPQGCRWFTLHVRDGTAIRIATSKGKVAGSNSPYFTLKANTSWDEGKLRIKPRTGLVLYFACSSSGKVVEIIAGIHDPAIRGEE
jgi:hypothetical protein